MKSFSLKTKESLCRLEMGELCCCEAEMMGIIMFAGRFKGHEIRVSLESREGVERFAALLKMCLGVTVEIEKLKNSFFCTLSDKKLLQKIVEYETAKTGFAETVAKNECCRDAFLRGAFLGGGTVIDPHKNYNMEFVTHSKKIHDGFKILLDEMDLKLRSVARKNCFVLYTKNSDIICDVLTHMGAFGAQMEVLNVKIEREVRNDFNRTANGETANMDKVITAAIKQIQAIEKIEERIGLDNLPDELKEVAVLRKDNKDLSLDELGKKMVPPLSKSGVNHRLKKLLSMSEDL